MHRSSSRELFARALDSASEAEAEAMRLGKEVELLRRASLNHFADRWAEMAEATRSIAIEKRAWARDFAAVTRLPT